MKKLVVLLSAGILAFSGILSKGSTVLASPVSIEIAQSVRGTQKAAELSSKQEETKLSAYDKAKQEILTHVDVAYTGLTAAGAPMYFLASNDGEYVALVLENVDEERYIKFIGSAVIDDDSGILTVTDSDKGYTFGFTAEQQSDGSFFLDCGNLGECYLEPDEPGDVVDYIINTFREMKDTTDELIEAMTSQDIINYIDIAFFGVTDADGVMYYLASSDGSFAALIIEDADETCYIKFVGTTTVDENGIQTVTDSEKGYRFSFIAEDLGDGSYFLDCGDLGTCYVEPDDPEGIMDFVNMTFEDMEDITDEFMAEYDR